MILQGKSRKRTVILLVVAVTILLIIGLSVYLGS